MAKSRRLHPQFFQTLVSGFHTHLIIPVEFFSKYIEGRSVEKTAELKSDESDVTWRVKMTGRRLSDGWEEFAVAHHLQIGDVVLVRYKGDMVFHVSDLGPDDCCEIPDIQPPSKNNDDGKILLKNHPRTDVGDDTDLPKKKKVKTKSNETELDSSEASNEEEHIEGERKEDECRKCNPKRRAVSYSSYSPSYKRFVTFTLPLDYVRIKSLGIPKLFLRENGINKPGEIYLLCKDGTKWPTSLLRDNKGTMSLGKGWKEFVKANGLESGFTLKLIWEETTPAFSLCYPESTSDREQEEYFKGIKKQSLFIDPINRFKINKYVNSKEESRQRDSSSPSPNRFVTITIRYNKMRLPKQFVKENSMNKSGVIYLLGKDDTKWMAKLVKERDGRMKLGNGWTVFAEANDFKPGESVTLESIWEDETPMLRFLRRESKISKANKKESISTEDTEPRTSDSSSTIQDGRFVTLTLTPEDVRARMLIIPSQFLKANGINKLGKITILGENKMETSAYILSRDGIVALENGWDEFCQANGVKLGESFTLEFINEPDKTTVLKFCSQ